MHKCRCPCHTQKAIQQLRSKYACGVFVVLCQRCATLLLPVSFGGRPIFAWKILHYGHKFWVSSTSTRSKAELQVNLFSCNCSTWCCLRLYQLGFANVVIGIIKISKGSSSSRCCFCFCSVILRQRENSSPAPPPHFSSSFAGWGHEWSLFLIVIIIVFVIITVQRQLMLDDEFQF